MEVSSYVTKKNSSVDPTNTEPEQCYDTNNLRITVVKTK